MEDGQAIKWGGEGGWYGNGRHLTAMARCSKPYKIVSLVFYTFP